MIVARILAMAIGSALLPAPTFAAEPLPLAKYGQLPSVSDIALSPDGATVAALVGNEDGRELQLRSLPDLQLINVYPLGRTKVRSLDWAGAGHLLVTTSTTARADGLIGERREWSQLADYDLKKRKWSGLLQNIEGSMNVVVGSPVVVSRGVKTEIVVEGLSVPHNVTTSTLYRINLDTGMTKQFDVGAPNTLDWVIGSDGHGIARADYSQRSGEWALMVRSGLLSSWKRVQTIVAPIDKPMLLGFGETADTVLVSTLEDDKWRVHAVGLADANWLPAVDNLESDSLIRDRASRLVIGSATGDMNGHRYVFLAEADQKLWDALQRAFPGEVVSLADWSDDRMTVIVEVEGPKNGDAFFLVDRRSHKAVWLANRYREIGPDAVGERRVVHYKAADGLDIPAYLTLPRNVAARALPLVVLPHGGPAARDEAGFDWWSQALASRGYAVLQPQFRGSEGFGTAHLAAGYGQWGRKMQTDLSDGVRQLAQDGIVDPKRVCIVGGSYGGYAALAGVALDPGVYRCAVAVAGVSDLRRMLRSEASGYYGSKSSTARYWKRFMGAEGVGDLKLDAFSPALQAAAIKAPVLLIHGKDDTVVPFEQSTVMADAMRKASGSVELVMLAAEDHWLSRGATRTQMLEATVAFLAKHNPAIVTNVQTAAK